MKLTLILIFTSYILVAQNVRGTIFDLKTNEPIENVNIFLKKNNSGSVSNKYGKFNLLIKSNINKSDTLQFSIIGYTTTKITLANLKQNDNIVFLSKKLEKLKPVNINTGIKLNSKLKFKKLSPLPHHVFSFASCITNNKIYLIAGNSSYFEDTAKKIINNSVDISLAEFIEKYRGNPSWEHYIDELQIYDIEKNTWFKSKLKFRKRAYNNVIYYKNKLYILGGKRLSYNKRFEYLDDKIELYNLKTNQIEIDDTNPHQAVNFASFTYKDNIIIMGGSTKLKRNKDKIYTDLSHIYNLSSGYWYELPKMTKPKEVNGVLIKDKIYLIGGFNKTPLTEIESYNLKTRKWDKEGDLFHGIARPALTYHNDIIYIFNKDKMLTYNTVTKTLEEYNINLNLLNSQLHYYEGYLYLIGGYIEFDYSKSPSSDLYRIDLNEFSKTKKNNLKHFN
jgi:hypothetical protein